MSFWVPKIESKQVFLAINPSPGVLFPNCKRNLNPSNDLYLKPQTRCLWTLKTYICPSLLIRSWFCDRPLLP